jgi:Ca2+-binding RTX toxin-like protein
MEEILVPANGNVVPNLGSNLSEKELPTDLIKQIQSDIEQSRKVSADIVKKLEESVLSSQPLQNKLSPLSPKTITPLTITINGTGGNDFLVGTNNPEQILASTVDDIVLGRGNNDQLFGGIGRDLLIGGDGNDILEGDSGDDQIFGGLGNDILNGGDGNDILIGIEANTLGNPNQFESDRLIGGAGVDTFVFGDQNNIFYRMPDISSPDSFATIQDFTKGEDIIQLKGDILGNSYQLARGIDPAGKVFTDIKLGNSDIIARVENVEILDFSTGFNFV